MEEKSNLSFSLFRCRGYKWNHVHIDSYILLKSILRFIQATDWTVHIMPSSPHWEIQSHLKFCVYCVNVANCGFWMLFCDIFIVIGFTPVQTWRWLIKPFRFSLGFSSVDDLVVVVVVVEIFKKSYSTWFLTADHSSLFGSIYNLLSVLY